MSSVTGVKGVLQAVAAGQTFSPEEMVAAVDVLTAEGTPAQMAAFLMGLRVRGERVEEIAGAARAMRQKMTAVSVAPEAIDIVGTGGDGHGTFNVSTGAALVAAGAGLKVAKHGNRSVSSLSGASDVLSALGVKLDCGPALIQRAVNEAGVGFLWAPAHHPSFKAWGPARAELGVRTLFNLLGPICNPANVRYHVVGVFAPGVGQPDCGSTARAGIATRLGGARARWSRRAVDDGTDHGCRARQRHHHLVRSVTRRCRTAARLAVGAQGR